MKAISLDQMQRALLRRRGTSSLLWWGQMLACYLLALLRDIFAGQLSLRAMSLVYTSLLSLVPLLALSFSLLKAFGVHGALRGMLDQFLAPLGPSGAQLSQHILGFVENMKIGVLGSVGVVLLVYTAISLIHKVEASFNFAWEVERGRGFSQGFGDYLSVLLIGPLLVFSALGLTASLKSSHFVAGVMSIQPFGIVLVLGFKLVPYLLMCAAFSFLYGFIPNTRVRVVPSVVAGICAGIAWQAVSVAFATFVSNAGKYNAIYSGFAIVIFLLIWLYIGWLVLLLGCRMAFYVQHPERLLSRPPPSLASREFELLALTACEDVFRALLEQRTPPTLDRLAYRLNVSEVVMERVMAPLLGSGVIVQAMPDGGYIPGRDLDQLSVAELWLSLRGDQVVPPHGERAAALLAETEVAVGGDTRSVKQWLAGDGERRDS